MKNSEITFTVTDILGLQGMLNFTRSVFLKGPSMVQRFTSRGKEIGENGVALWCAMGNFWLFCQDLIGVKLPLYLLFLPIRKNDQIKTNFCVKYGIKLNLIENWKIISNAPVWYVRRNIRLIESNAKCRYLQKFTCKGTLWHVFICLRLPPLLCFCFGW